MQPPDESLDKTTHFIVDLGGSEFVLCQRVVTADGGNGLDAMPREAIDDLLRAEPLRAAPLKAGFSSIPVVMIQVADDDED